jgi:hypothetical protein
MINDLIILFQYFEKPIALSFFLLAVGLVLQHFNRIANKRRSESQEEIIQHLIEQEAIEKSVDDYVSIFIEEDNRDLCPHCGKDLEDFSDYGCEYCSPSFVQN